jgi:hypothetical protein
MANKRDSDLRNPAQLGASNGAESKRHFPRYQTILWAVLSTSIFAFSSCVDLSEITQLAKSSQDVGNSFKQIADETLNSCKRANTFIPTGQQALSCDVYARTEPSLIKVNDVFFAYIASLGKLAGAGTAKKDELANISTDLKQADKDINQENIDRATKASGLADAITHIIVSGYQQHELGKIIGDQNAAVQAVAVFLSGYSADKCETALEEEKLLQKNYFQDQLEKYGAHEPLAAYLLRAKDTDYKASIDGKIQAVKKYKLAVSSVASAHQKLFEQRNKWSTRQLITDLAPEIQQLSDSATSMIKAFQ